MAVSLDELHEPVETAGKAKQQLRHNGDCCYDEAQMIIHNMVRQDVLGEVLHAECGYLHDLRQTLLTDHYVESWRLKHHRARDGDLYLTHGVGP